MRYKFEDIIYNITEKKKPTEEDRLNYIGLEHLDSGSLFVSRWGSDVTPEGEKIIMKKGDVLFGKRRAYQKKVAISPIDGVFSAHGMVLRPKENVICKEYLPFFISSDYFLNEAIRISVGGLSPTINWKDIKVLEFDLPSLSEQKLLAEKLWAAYKVKQSYIKMIEATDEMVKSQFIEMFGTPSENEKKLPVKRLNEISENLDSKRVPITSGNRIAGQYPYYGASGIVDYVHDYLFDETLLLISEDGANLKDRVTPIAFTATGKYWVNNHAHIVKFKDEATHCYVEYFINYLNVEKYLTGMAQPKLNQDRLNSIPISFPEIDAQRHFNEIVQQADKSKFELRKSVEAINKVIKSLINENL